MCSSRGSPGLGGSVWGAGDGCANIVVLQVRVTQRLGEVTPPPHPCRPPLPMRTRPVASASSLLRVFRQGHGARRRFLLSPPSGKGTRQSSLRAAFSRNSVCGSPGESAPSVRLRGGRCVGVRVRPASWWRLRAAVQGAAAWKGSGRRSAAYRPHLSPELHEFVFPQHCRKMPASHGPRDGMHCPVGLGISAL